MYLNSCHPHVASAALWLHQVEGSMWGAARAQLPPAHQSSESGLTAAPLLSVSLARTPDRGLVTINIASRRFLAPLNFTFSTLLSHRAV